MAEGIPCSFLFLSPLSQSTSRLSAHGQRSMGTEILFPLLFSFFSWDVFWGGSAGNFCWLEFKEFGGGDWGKESGFSKKRSLLDPISSQTSCETAAFFPSPPSLSCPVLICEISQSLRPCPSLTRITFRSVGRPCCHSKPSNLLFIDCEVLIANSWVQLARQSRPILSADAQSFVPLQECHPTQFRDRQKESCLQMVCRAPVFIFSAPSCRGRGEHIRVGSGGKRTQHFRVNPKACRCMAHLPRCGFMCCCRLSLVRLLRCMSSFLKFTKEFCEKRFAIS